MGTFLKNRVLPSGQNAVIIPGGTTAERPSAPVFGAFRYNTSTTSMEYFNGTIYKQIANTGEANITVDSFTGDNSTLTFFFFLVFCNAILDKLGFFMVALKYLPN